MYDATGESRKHTTADTLQRIKTFAYSQVDSMSAPTCQWSDSQIWNSLINNTLNTFWSLSHGERIIVNIRLLIQKEIWPISQFGMLLSISTIQQFQYFWYGYLCKTAITPKSDSNMGKKIKKCLQPVGLVGGFDYNSAAQPPQVTRPEYILYVQSVKHVAVP